MRVRFRILPFVIFIGAIIISLRVESLWETYSGSALSPAKKAPFISLSSSADAQGTNPVTVKQPETPAPPAGSDTPQPPADGTTADLAAITPRTLPAFDERASYNYSSNEVEILQRLAERRESIESREREVDVKIVSLEAAEQQLDAKIKRLEELQAAIKALVGEYDEKEGEKMSSLVNIYSQMKPKDAARIFNELEMPVLIKIFSQMKDSKAAAILSVMESEKANALTLELANMNRPDFVRSE